MTSNVSHKDNCFDLLRLIAASMVIFFHQNMFTGGGFVTDPSDWFPMDSIWVQIFISLSGFLVSMSFMRSKSFNDFMWKRIKRLFPALVFCNFVVVFLIAPFWQEHALQYIISLSTIKSFIKMSILFSYGNDIPHLWTDYGWLQAANAPIWTLTHEFFLYILGSLAFGLSRTWKAPTALLIIFMLCQIFIAPYLAEKSFYSMNAHHFTELGTNFSIGALMYVTINSWNSKNTKIFLAAISVIILFALRQEQGITIAGRVCISVLTIIIGVSFKDLILKGKMDISYGMYIWAFPIQAIVINVLHLGFYYGTVATFIITGIVAAISRKYIEEPFMRRK